MKEKLHIVHVIPTLRFGGAERFVVDLANNLDEKKFISTIILFSDDAPLRSELYPHVKIVIIKKKGKLSFRLFFDLKKLFKKIHPDIVHTNLFGADVWARIVAHRMHIPVVTTEHNINVGEGRIKHMIKKYLYSYSTFYTCPSNAIAGYMNHAFGIKSRHISIIRYGIDIQKFIKVKRIPDFASPRFLIIGRLVQQKGHAIALSALAQLKKYNWHLDIVGGGEDYGLIKRMILNLEISDRVRMIEPTTNTPSVYGLSDIVLVPSNWEGLGMVVMEAMATGRLVVGSETGGIPEMIDHKKNGLLVKPSSVDALKDMLLWIFKNPKACKVLAKSAKEKAQNEFEIYNMIEEYQKIYSRIIT